MLGIINKLFIAETGDVSRDCTKDSLVPSSLVRKLREKGFSDFFSLFYWGFGIVFYFHRRLIDSKFFIHRAGRERSIKALVGN